MVDINEVAENIYLIDDQLYSIPKMGCVYLLNEDKKALIESGPSTSANAVLDGIREAGVRPEDIAYIIVTHIHLDHAGGAGVLIKDMPHAQVIVHHRGEILLVGKVPTPNNCETHLHGVQFVASNWLLNENLIDPRHSISRKGRKNDLTDLGTISGANAGLVPVEMVNANLNLLKQAFGGIAGCQLSIPFFLRPSCIGRLHLWRIEILFGPNPGLPVWMGLTKGQDAITKGFQSRQVFFKPLLVTVQFSHDILAGLALLCIARRKLDKLAARKIENMH